MDEMSEGVFRVWHRTWYTLCGEGALHCLPSKAYKKYIGSRL